MRGRCRDAAPPEPYSRRACEPYLYAKLAAAVSSTARWRVPMGTSAWRSERSVDPSPYSLHSPISRNGPAPVSLVAVELPLDRAPHEELVTAVLAWKEPNLTPRDYEQTCSS